MTKNNPLAKQVILRTPLLAKVPKTRHFHGTLLEVDFGPSEPEITPFWVKNEVQNQDLNH